MTAEIRTTTDQGRTVAGYASQRAGDQWAIELTIEGIGDDVQMMQAARRVARSFPGWADLPARHIVVTLTQRVSRDDALTYHYTAQIDEAAL